MELIEWPTTKPALPLGLSRLDAAGEPRLATRLPTTPPGALSTAETLLRWVTNHWRHSGVNHDSSQDANAVLDRVAHGERFACLEYTVVLTQALNAVSIPARRMNLYQADYHAGMGTSHSVTEAWIDDLGAWVVLDGQNGAVWRDAEGTPLSALKLQRRYRDGDRPEFSGGGHNYNATNAGYWFEYFHTVGVRDGLAWSTGSYVPIMEGSTVIVSSRLASSDEDAAPIWPRQHRRGQPVRSRPGVPRHPSLRGGIRDHRPGRQDADGPARPADAVGP